MTREEIFNLIEEEDVEFIRLQFTDSKGMLKNIAVTASQLPDVLDHKCVFDGAALTGQTREISEDLYLSPDLDTFVILPWRPQQGKVARFLCDIYKEDGSICLSSPRMILKKVLEDAKKEGYTFYVEPENEFFLYHTDDAGMPTTRTHDQAGYLDVGPVDLGENARRDMVLALEDMGFKVESSHHEQGPAQHEIDFSGSEALECCDSIVTFRNTVRSIAKRFGLHATFMPKPCEGVPGSGMHLNLTVYKDDRNIFNSKTDEVKDQAKWFIGGIMAHANALCALTNPTVNSYKRLCTGFDAPSYKIWSTKKVNSLVRVKNRPGQDTKIELRFPDSASNPYLVMAAAVLAGLDGIKKQSNPGAPLLDYGKRKNFETRKNKLPITLIEAIYDFKRDTLLMDGLGEDFTSDYIQAKEEEWNSFMEEVSEWEINQYLFKI